MKEAGARGGGVGSVFAPARGRSGLAEQDLVARVTALLETRLAGVEHVAVVLGSDHEAALLLRIDPANLIGLVPDRPAADPRKRGATRRREGTGVALAHRGDEVLEVL